MTPRYDRLGKQHKKSRRFAAKNPTASHLVSLSGERYTINDY